MTDPTLISPPDEPDRHLPDTDTEQVHVLLPHTPQQPAAPAPAAVDDDRVRVQWVRPTDLAARAGAVTLEKTAEAHRRSHQIMRQAVREATRTGQDRIRRLLARRQEDLTAEIPTTTETRPTLGRQGVSR